MTIGIDIRVLALGTKSGIEEYTENLLAHLLPLNKNIKFKLFYSSFKNDLKKYEWMKLPNVEVFNFRFPNKLLFGLARLFNRPHVDRLIGGVDVLLLFTTCHIFVLKNFFLGEEIFGIGFKHDH